MTTENPWHDDDDFWKAVEPALFSEDRLAQAKPDVAGIVNLLGLKPGARILDLCSGPGRHAMELARQGFRVTAVDRTRAYLDRARKAARGLGLEIEFVEADMREFVRARAFDAVINMYTSFGFFDDDAENARVLENIYLSLGTGGSVLIDLNSKEIATRNFQERTWLEIDDVLLLIQQWVDTSWRTLETRWILVREGRSRELRWKLRLYSSEELKKLLKSKGFRAVRLYGAMTGAPFDRFARRLVAVGQK